MCSAADLARQPCRYETSRLRHVDSLPAGEPFDQPRNRPPHGQQHHAHDRSKPALQPEKPRHHATTLRFTPLSKPRPTSPLEVPGQAERRPQVGRCLPSERRKTPAPFAQGQAAAATAWPSSLSPQHHPAPDRLAATRVAHHHLEHRQLSPRQPSEPGTTPITMPMLHRLALARITLSRPRAGNNPPAAARPPRLVKNSHRQSLPSCLSIPKQQQ